jgi:hypothetical protein
LPDLSRRLLVALSLVACKHDSDAPAPAPSATASASASIVASATAPSPIASYVGTYNAVPGVLFIPDGAPWEKLRQPADDAGAQGEGTLAFTVEADGGALTGELKGPLGPAGLTGVVEGTALSFHVTPAAQELTFSGTGTGTLDGGSVTGEIHVSSWRANILRTATFHAQRQ